MSRMVAQGFRKLGFSHPTANQSQIIQSFEAKNNILWNSGTGTGKSIAFSILASTNFEGCRLKTLYILPSRDLVLQVKRWTHILSPSNLKDTTQFIYNSTFIDLTSNVNKSIDITSDCRMIVGTPNKILDLFRKGLLNFDYLNLLIVDEIDRVLDLKKNKKLPRRSENDFGIKESSIRELGIKESSIKNDSRSEGHKLIDMILDNKKVQIIAGSATIPRKVESYLRWKLDDNLIYYDHSHSKSYLNTEFICYYLDQSGTLINYNHTNPSDTISNDTVNSYDRNPGDKLSIDIAGLKGQLHIYPADHHLILDWLANKIKQNPKKTIIFSSTSISSKKIASNLQKSGLKAQTITQSHYSKTSIDDVDILVASDYEARGLDLGVEVCFILGPMSRDLFMHCCGRVGRFGRRGTVITLLGGPAYILEYQATLNYIVNTR